MGSCYIARVCPKLLGSSISAAGIAGITGMFPYKQIVSRALQLLHRALVISEMGFSQNNLLGLSSNGDPLKYLELQA
jgi:hypothetical protein